MLLLFLGILCIMYFSMDTLMLYTGTLWISMLTWTHITWMRAEWIRTHIHTHLDSTASLLLIMFFSISSMSVTIAGVSTTMTSPCWRPPEPSRACRSSRKCRSHRKLQQGRTASQSWKSHSRDLTVQRFLKPQDIKQFQTKPLCLFWEVYDVWLENIPS